MEMEQTKYPIRILHMIGGLNVGGSQMFVMNIYRHINREKVQFDFVLDHPEENYLVPEIEAMGGKIYSVPAFNGSNAAHVRQVWDNFFRTHKEYRILHSHIRSYASLYLPIAKKYGVTTIIHSHSTSNGSGLKAFAKKILQYPLRFQADYFMACSPAAGQWLFGRRVCRSSRFITVNNAIDTDRFQFDCSARKKIRDAFKISENAFVVGVISRVVEPKNPLFSLDVFSQILKLNKNAVMLFVGDGDLINKVKLHIQELKIEEHVILTGTRSDTDKLLSAMDVYLFPSLWEGLGISLIEAQASGIHSFCSENVPKTAIITDSVTALPLSIGAEQWAQSVLEYAKEYTRRDNRSCIRAAGFDICQSAAEIQKFYLSNA